MKNKAVSTSSFGKLLLTSETLMVLDNQQLADIHAAQVRPQIAEDTHIDRETYSCGARK
jgi:hypothetical protein